MENISKLPLKNFQGMIKREEKCDIQFYIFFFFKRTSQGILEVIRIFFLMADFKKFSHKENTVGLIFIYRRRFVRVFHMLDVLLCI